MKTAELQQERESLSERTRDGAARDRETKLALLNKARDDAAQFKQISEKTTAELQQEREKATALAQEAAAARQELERERARGTALVSELRGKAARSRPKPRSRKRQSMRPPKRSRRRRPPSRNWDNRCSRSKKDCCPDAGSQGRASDDDGCRATAPRTRRRAGPCRSPRERVGGEKPRDRDPSRAVAKGSRCGHQTEAGGGGHHRGTGTIAAAGAKEDCCPDAGSQGRASDDDGCRAPRPRRGAGACRSPRERVGGEKPRDRDPSRAVAKGSR